LEAVDGEEKEDDDYDLSDGDDDNVSDDDVDDDGGEDDSNDGGDEIDAAMQDSDDGGGEIDEAMQDSDDGEDEIDEAMQDSDDNVEIEDDAEEDYASDDKEDGEDADGGGEWEDIYGRKRSRDGAILSDNAASGTGGANVATSGGGGKYIPPALRNTAASSNKKKELERLAKQVKGNLNRLAESNMHSIASQIEGLYGNNSRNDMNATLWTLVSAAVVGPSLTPERLVTEYTMLVAILHANIGSEVGAHFLEEIVKQFNSIYSSTNLAADSDKKMDNLVLLLAYHFNFKIVSSALMFDLMNKMADSFTTKDIELILIALRSCGFSLRKEDPVGMKNLILRIKNAATAQQDGENSTRVQFMLDILMAVKNNNVNKIPNYDPSHFDHLKKTLKSFIREGKFVTELKIGLKDIEEAETRGRWWIVGSFFAGNLVGEKRGAEAAPTTTENTHEFSEKLMRMARKMRMNTDSRKNIFCLIMSSEDYIDATMRLTKLGTKNQTEREVMFVLLECSLKEANFNPFYSQVAIKLSSLDRRYKIANQFSLWDKLKQSAGLKEVQLNHLAKFISHLVREKSQSISVLRIIEFAEMTKPNVKLLRTVLCDVLLLEKEEDVRTIFQGVAGVENLKLFREGLRLFLRHFLLKQKNKLDPSINFQALENRVKSAELYLTSPGSSLKL